VSFSSLFVGFSCAVRFIDSEAFVFGFICGDHGYMSCASLCLILTPQTSDLVSDSWISVRSLALCLISVVIRFPMI
jgi:hypothetical protein